MGQLFPEISKDQLRTAEVIFIVNRFDSFNSIKQYYFDSLQVDKVAAFKAVPMKAEQIRQFFIEHIKHYPNAKLFLVNDAIWFKALTRKSKVTPTIGTFYNLTNCTEECNHIRIGYIPDVKEVMYNVQAEEDVKFIFSKIRDFLNGTYTVPGLGLRDYVTYITDVDKIKSIIADLHNYKELACDIETYSLYLDETGIASISFSPTDTSAFAFTVEFNHTLEESNVIYEELRQFFLNYRGKFIFHNGSFDVTILVNSIFMRGLLTEKDKYKLMYQGLDVILKDFDDTKLMAYLCYNSCVRPELGLKYLSKDYTGDYALYELENIKSYSSEELLVYNGLDTIGTKHIFDNLRKKIVGEDQVDIYENFYKKALYELIVMQLVGLPLNPENVEYATKVVNNDYETALSNILKLPLVQEFSLVIREDYVKKKNASYKKKQITVDDCTDIQMNPESGPQLKKFLYEFLNLPVIEFAKSGGPSTSKDTLIKLLDKTNDAAIKEVLNELIKLADVSVIKDNFITNFNRNPNRLYGYFNLGTVVTGRLSATNNLQTIPSKGTKYADLIKQCFKVPEGYLLIGIDYSSLEDFISALLTKDKNKLKVYMPISIYKVEVDGKTYYLSDDDEIIIDNISYKPSDLL